MGRIKIIISQDGEQRVEMGIEEGLKIALKKSRLYSEDKEKETFLIKEISACLDEYRNKNGALTLLEVQESEKLLIKIMIE